MRKELVLQALDAELTADTARDQILVNAMLLKAGIGDALQEIMGKFSDDLGKVAAYRLMDSKAMRGTRSGPTIDGMFKIYQALIDKGIIKKQNA